MIDLAIGAIALGTAAAGIRAYEAITDRIELRRDRRRQHLDMRTLKAERDIYRTKFEATSAMLDELSKVRRSDRPDK